MSTLEPFPDAPRRKPRALMHVVDAGHRCIEFACGRCGYRTDWLFWDRSVSEAKRGIPCPHCNEDAGQ